MAEHHEFEPGSTVDVQFCPCSNQRAFLLISFGISIQVQRFMHFASASHTWARDRPRPPTACGGRSTTSAKQVDPVDFHQSPALRKEWENWCAVTMYLYTWTYVHTWVS